MRISVRDVILARKRSTQLKAPVHPIHEFDGQIGRPVDEISAIRRFMRNRDVWRKDAVRTSLLA
jgi:hypothetical protein